MLASMDQPKFNVFAFLRGIVNCINYWCNFHEIRPRASAGAPIDLEPSKQKWRKIWPWVLVNSLAGQTFGVSCMQWALETTPTGIVLAIIAVTPIVVIPFTFVFEGEQPTMHSLVGGAIAVAGVVGLALSR